MKKYHVVLLLALGFGPAQAQTPAAINGCVYNSVLPTLVNGQASPFQCDVNGKLLTTASGGGGAVSSVFGRTGAVVAAANDYNFNQLAGNWALAQGPTIGANTVLGSVAGGVPAALTQTQLTALINPATTTLSGALPAWPNNTTTFFRGDGTYTAVSASVLTGLGTGVATALGVNVGSAGAFVTFNGALGTPSSGALTNATGLPISTGVSGLGAGVATFLGTPSSANLIAAVSDETGTGALVFGTSPTISTADVRGTWTTGTSWTLPALTLGGTVSGGGNQINNVVIGTTTPLAGAFTTVKTPIIGPTANSTTAFKITKADLATAVMTFDTTNARVGINKTPGAFDLDVNGPVNLASTLAVTGHLTLEGVTSTGATGTGNLAFSASPVFTGTVTAGTTNVGGQLTISYASPNLSLIDVGTSFSYFQIQNAGGTNNMRVGSESTGGGNIFTGSSGLAGVIGTTVNTALQVFTNNALAATFQPSGGLSVGTMTDPGVGGLQLNAQIFMPNITTTSAAQTGTVCWTTGTGKFTVDTTVGCLTSLEEAKDKIAPLAPSDAIMLVERLEPFSFRYKLGWGDSGRYEQFGLGANQVASVDERMVGRDYNGTLQGVRYQELTAVLVGAIKHLKADVDQLERRIAR